jgi:hypothetical protein
MNQQGQSEQAKEKKKLQKIHKWKDGKSRNQQEKIKRVRDEYSINTTLDCQPNLAEQFLEQRYRISRYQHHSLTR